MKPIAGTVVIDEQGIDLADFEPVVIQQAPVRVSQACYKAVSDCRAFLNHVLADGQIVYGVNTGFGKLASVILPEEQTRTLQVNLIRSHA